MKKILIFICSILCGSAALANINITNGSDVPQGKYPFFVYIGLQSKSIGPHFGSCGGALISNNWVITAKHCMWDYYPDLGYGAKVVIGSSNLSIPNTYESAIVTKTFYYNDKDSTNGSDIALIKLDRNISYPPINLPDHEAVAGEYATVIGSGTTSDNHPHSDILQEVMIPIDNYSDCNSLNILPDKEICAGTTSGFRENAALGDSGGPLFQYINGSYYLVGIVSRGKMDWIHPLAAVYTDVYKFKNWIESTIATQ